MFSSNLRSELKMEIQKSELPYVSIVVPTLNRKMHLRHCINSLMNLEYPFSKFEVIVVDNGSTDGTTELLKTEFPKVRVIIEKRRNSCYARNTGWKNARGKIVAYTDDDCIVDSAWLKTLVSAFVSEQIGGVGGPLLLTLIPKSVVEKFFGTPVGDFYKGDKKIFVKELITANLAVRYDVFKKNRFDISLTYTALEDIDFCRSLTRTGYRLLYIPDAKVYHNMNPKRLTLPSVLKRAFYEGISIYILEKKDNGKAFLIIKFLKETLGGVMTFFIKRRIENLFYLVQCFFAFLSSLFFIAT